MSEELPAEQLLARVAHHDIDALSELYDRYVPRIYGMVARILPSRASAEEVLQELFLRLWSESAALNEQGKSVTAWLIVTAREAAVHRLRALRKKAAEAAPSNHGAETTKKVLHRQRAKSVVPTSSTEKSEVKSPGGISEAWRGHSPDGVSVACPVPIAWLPQPSEVTRIDDRLVLLCKVIDQLPKPQRQALELAVFDGLNENEIAAELGEPLGKVRTSLRAALTFVKHRRRAVCGSWAANI